MNNNYYIYFAQIYNQNAYGACQYNTNTTGCTTSNTGLSNTGLMVAGVVTLAAMIILLALVVRIWRRPRRLAPQEVDADNEDNDDAQSAN